MSEVRKFQAVSGVRDILPPDSALWNRVEEVARNVFATYDFSDIRLPIFEETELFARSVGAASDIVGKEMYTFADRDDSSVSLRPEATASVVRAYIEHGMHTLAGDVKLYYMGPMFRRERPQKGRYRQFYQIGAEVLTPAPKDVPDNFSRDAGIDADVIEMVLVFIERCGLVGHTLHINSIGCRDCRPKYVEVLRAALVAVKDKLGPDSQRRIETNPLRVLDSKLESEQAVIEALPRIADHLCEACREHFKMLQAMLFMRQIAYEVNWRLVRGLDYYMRTTFEITAPGLGSQNAVCGGGRYDGLVELLGGPPTKGIGFALGTDRLILALQEAGKGAVAKPPDAYIAWMGASAYGAAVRVARALRDAGFAVELPHDEMKFKKSLGLAGRLNARYAVILGDNEVAAGTVTLKRMADGSQQTVPEAGLAGHLRA
ncbi:MAG TPA: histidine--tRNA ligase [Candidatus Acidoferrales bacterium]|nr:histidine--tRNA ligase [Candidatus Acidoferrales bacterium]